MAPPTGKPNTDKRRKYCYDYPRAMLTVDAVILRTQDGVLEVLLIRRQRPPYKGRWALPGGFVEMGESLEESVRREIKEETGIRRVTRLRQIGAYGDPGRDPRGRTVTVAYLGVVSGTGAAAKGGDDAAEAQWYPISSLPKDLAFDHALILRDGLRLFHRNLRLCRRDYA